MRRSGSLLTSSIRGTGCAMCGRSHDSRLRSSKECTECMKILSITAGAAGMYCGSCLRDNALAAELIAEGHDVILLPLFTPTLTDEVNVSADKVFFGGISVYLEQKSALFRHLPPIVDSLWDSMYALRAASKRSIATSPQLLGELTVSILKGEDGNQRKEFGKLVDWLRHEAPPDRSEERRAGKECRS